jgi:hypothetical protein
VPASTRSIRTARVACGSAAKAHPSPWAGGDARRLGVLRFHLGRGVAATLEHIEQTGVQDDAPCLAAFA